MNYYVLFGITPDATPEEIKHAYIRLAKMYHPDKNSSPDATVKMAEINLAYEILRDARRRKEYDLENDIGAKNEAVQEFFDRYAEQEEEEIGVEEEEEEPSHILFGKCIRCNVIHFLMAFMSRLPYIIWQVHQMQLCQQFGHVCLFGVRKRV